MGTFLQIKSDEIYRAHEKQRYHDFLLSLSNNISFEDDNWFCEKRLKNVSHNRVHTSISFRKIPKQYKEMVKYFALNRLVYGTGVYTVSCRVRNIGVFLRFLDGTSITDINIHTATRLKEFFNHIGYTERTCRTIWDATGIFLSVMNGYDGLVIHNPFYRNCYIVGEALDYKYIPDYVTKQLDQAFMDESIPLHLRTIYWILRLIPSRIGELLGMWIDCLKPFDGHFCLSIPTWKQNGGYKEPILRIIHINDDGIGGYLLALIREQQKIALSYQDLVASEKKDALFTNREIHKRNKDKIYYRNVYSPLTYAQVYNNFKKICEEFNIRDENGKIVSAQ